MTESACSSQKDLFNSDGVYLKTICSVSTNYTRQSTLRVCDSQQMILARSDDREESEAFLLYQASKDYPTGGTIWIRGESNGQCSVVYASSSNYSVTTRTCSSVYPAYCEYDRDCFISFLFLSI